MRRIKVHAINGSVSKGHASTRSRIPSRITVARRIMEQTTAMVLVLP
jgi:hypothetical protein